MIFLVRIILENWYIFKKLRVLVQLFLRFLVPSLLSRHASCIKYISFSTKLSCDFLRVEYMFLRFQLCYFLILNLWLIMIFYILHDADIRRSARPFLEDKTNDDFFQIDVRISVILFWLNS